MIPQRLMETAMPETSLCPRHPDNPKCPYNLALQAAEIIAGTHTDREAAAVAAEAMRFIAKAAGSPPPKLT